MALSQTTVLKVYKSVIEDVIAGVRELFLDDGVDEQVLVELRHLWESKLMSSKAIDINPEPPEPQPPLVTTSVTANTTVASGGIGNHSGMNHFQGNVNTQATNSTATANAQNTVLPEPNKTVPVQITLPPQAGSNDTHPRVLTIQVPASAIQGKNLYLCLNIFIIKFLILYECHFWWDI
ncbi:hypothetical protein J437_LFUL012617 [Ladona fulva]|uniref:Transcription initiation factor IIA subunit 1 n=1 Tax=Ladona fulva TaxID=123851 RepID=A0A8K0P4D1_LADFU|nr:hypothetical protein J437_LFUL012617 [Ladona fulva]